MGVNKVVYGGETVVNMTDATATPDSVLVGYTAYGADGNLIVGAATTTKRQEVKVTLPCSGWVDGQQTVAVPGVTELSSIIAAGSSYSAPDYDDCGVYCSAQGDGTLTFTAYWQPDTDLTADVLILT